MIASPIVRSIWKGRGGSVGPNPLGIYPYDDFEAYVPSANIDGKTYGWSWSGAWIGGTSGTNIYANDDMQSYNTGSTVSGSSGGTSWSGSYFTN